MKARRERLYIVLLVQADCGYESQKRLAFSTALTRGKGGQGGSLSSPPSAARTNRGSNAPMWASNTRQERYLVNAAVLAAAVFGLLALAGGASAVAGTDVAVATPDISFSNPSPVDGSTVSILVIVHNLGNETATNVIVSAALSSTGELLGTAAVGSVAGQSQLETAILWNVSGEGNLTVTVSVQSQEADVQPANNNAISQPIFVRSRPDLRVDSVTFDNNAPAPGTVAVGIFATVSNVGGSDATLVKVALYDGPPATGTQIFNTTVLSVTLTSPQTIVYYWDLAEKGGRHDIYAVVESATPAEKATSMDNNWASGRLLVLTYRDFVVTSTVVINVDPLFQGFVIVRAGGNLTIADSNFKLHQQRDNQYDFIVENGGKLTLDGASVTSDYTFGVTVQPTGAVWLKAGSDLEASVASTGGSLWCYNSTVGGALTGSFSTLHLEDCAVGGGATVSSPNAGLYRSSISSPGTVEFTASVVYAEWLLIEAGGDPALSFAGGSSADLRGIQAGSILVESGSLATVSREARFVVSDLTGIPIAGATVDSRWGFSGGIVATAVTDAQGRASSWLVTDVLDGGAPQYQGSYIHTASYLIYHATAVTNLAFYPTLTAESNSQEIELTFEVIDPSDLFLPTVGDRVVEGAPWEISNFNQTGNIEVRGSLNVNGALTIWQTRAFEVALVIKDTGTVTVGPGGAIRSNLPLNIYNFNGSLVANGGAIDVNAIVTFGTASVSLTNGTTVSHGSFILQGSSFTLGTGVTVTGTRLYARGATSVILDGANVGLAVVDVVTAGDITVKGSVLTSATDITLRSTASDKTLTTMDSAITCGAFGKAAFEAHFIDMDGTNVQTCAMVLFSADTVQARDTGFSQPLTGFRAGSTAALYDVTYPALIVDPSAIVTTFHKLTISVMDINQNIVTDGTFSIVGVPGGQDKGSGGLGALIEKDLEASTITLGFENFTGNYRVTVTPAAEGASPLTRDVVMDAARQEFFLFSQEIVLPSSVEVEADATPASTLAGGIVTIEGRVLLVYPNRAAPLVPRPGTPVKILENGSVLLEASTDANGLFNWTGEFRPNSTTPGVKQLTVQATYQGVAGSTVVAVELLRPNPDQLLLKLDLALFEKNVGGEFFISGQVTYIRPDGSEEPAPNVTVRASFVNPPQTDAQPTGHSNGAGVFNFRVPGRNSAKIYSMVVDAFDDVYGLPSNTVPVTVQVGQAPAGTTQGLGSGITLYLLAAAGLAVAGVIGFMVVNARRQSVNYVECGNCGRPAHEGDKKCPSCGVEFEADIAKCSHCASWIPADAVRCPKCNTEFKPIGDAEEAPKVAPDVAAPEGVKAEVTTVAAPAAVKAPVAVKKKVLKTAEPAGQPPQAEGPKYENPWDQPGEKSTPAGGEPTSDQAKPAEKKPDEKKEKGLFDDL